MNLDRNRAGSQAIERTHLAGGLRERVLGHFGAVAVEHAQHRDALGDATVDQRVLRLQVGGQVAFGEEGAVAEGFLDINHYQTGFHGRLAEAVVGMRLSSVRSEPTSEPPRTGFDQFQPSAFRWRSGLAVAACRVV